MKEETTATSNTNNARLYLTPRLKDVWTFQERLHRAWLLILGNSIFLAWIEPIEITEEEKDTLTGEAMNGLKGDDKILPEFYFRLGMEAILSK